MSSIAGQLSQFTQKEASELFSRARTITRNYFFNLLVAPQAKKFGRILIVTPRRVGSAPERNKLKRRIKAIFYEERLFERGYDCIIIFKKKAVDLSFDTLKKLLLESFDKLN